MKTLNLILCLFLAAPLFATPNLSDPNYQALLKENPREVSKYKKCEAWCLSASFTIGATMALAAAVAYAQGNPSPFAHLIENFN